MTKSLKTIIFAGTIVSLFLLLMPVVFPLSSEAGADWIVALGRFHILVLHFPIALILIVPVLEILSSFKPLQFVKQTIPVILVLAILFALKACVLGYTLATGEGDSSGLLVTHMWGGIIATVLLIIAFILHQLSSFRLSRLSYFCVLGLSIISLILGTHSGASLVHGENYLTEKIPTPIKSAFQTGKIDEPITKESSAYTRLIKPIFEAHCYLCHSAAKQKGDFRMDEYDLLLYGGESGMAGMEPNSLEDSEVHHRITVDPSKKGFMPPEGNKPLTSDQIALIEWWIKNGASPTQPIKKYAEESLPEAIQKQLSEIP